MPAVSKGSEVHFTPWINQMQPEKSGPCRPSSKLPQAPKQLQDSFLRQLCVAISRYANTLIGGRQGCFGTTPGDIRIGLGVARDQVHRRAGELASASVREMPLGAESF